MKTSLIAVAVIMTLCGCVASVNATDVVHAKWNTLSSKITLTNGNIVLLSIDIPDGMSKETPLIAQSRVDMRVSGDDHGDWWPVYSFMYDHKTGWFKPVDGNFSYSIGVIKSHVKLVHDLNETNRLVDAVYKFDLLDEEKRKRDSGGGFVSVLEHPKSTTVTRINNRSWVSLEYGDSTEKKMVARLDDFHYLEISADIYSVDPHFVSDAISAEDAITKSIQIEVIGSSL